MCVEGYLRSCRVDDLLFVVCYLLFIIMASFDLSWTPADSAITVSQEVQYKEAASSTWLVAATLSATADSYTASDLDDNTIYDFRIVTDCAFGGPTPTAPYQVIDFVCPEMTIDATFELVNFSFLHVGGSVTEYEVELLDASGTSVLDSDSFSSPSGTVSGSFTGLDPDTSYQIRVSLSAGFYSESCVEDFDTAGVPSCAVPSNVTVEMLYEEPPPR